MASEDRAIRGRSSLVEDVRGDRKTLYIARGTRAQREQLICAVLCGRMDSWNGSHRSRGHTGKGGIASGDRARR
jgi:hypothetical protein